MLSEIVPLAGPLCCIVWPDEDKWQRKEKKKGGEEQKQKVKKGKNVDQLAGIFFLPFFTISTMLDVVGRIDPPA